MRFPEDDPETAPGPPSVHRRAGSIRGHGLSPVRPQRTQAARAVARLLAQFRRGVASRNAAGDRPASVRSGDHSFRPGQQLRPALRPGPYGDLGSRKYLLASLDRSLKRLGLDYVDIFYSHRLDPDTPLEETLGALDTAVRQGKALYAGISSYPPAETRQAAAILRGLGTPLLIHQPSYSLLNRWIEDGLLDVLGEEGIGCIPFSPLAQGQLTDRYLNGVPAGSRATNSPFLGVDEIDKNLPRVRGLNEIAARRGQTLAQMALAWVLRDPRVTSAIIGASSVKQLEDNVRALDKLDFEPSELAEIDRCLAARGGKGG